MVVQLKGFDFPQHNGWDLERLDLLYGQALLVKMDLIERIKF